MSTIKVDAIQTTGGASEIAIDKLKGVSSASSISVVAEGGTTTTNLQQGLAKGWCHFTGTDSSISYSDSLNMSGLTDNGAGSHAINYSNNMGNAFYVSHITGSTNRNGCIDTTTITTSTCTLETRTFENVATDAHYCMFSMQGDLA
jgi:hypothetical protein